MSEPSMRSEIVLTGFGGYDKLAVHEATVAVPSLLDDQLLVRVRACGANFADNYVRQGLYVHGHKRPPFVMGMEAAGDVIRVGSAVTRFKEGDRVMCWCFTYGLWTSLAAVPEQNCFAIPNGMSYSEAAAFPINYVTAYLSICDFGGLRKGYKVLVQAAGGGVGWAATQLCHTVEDVTVYGTSSASKFSLTQQNGVTHPIDYHTEDFIAAVRKMEPNGVDIIMDCLSGGEFTRARALLKPMGRAIHIGVSSMVWGQYFRPWKTFQTWWQTKLVNVYHLSKDSHAVCGLNLATVSEKEPQRVLDVMQHLTELYEQGKIKPHIDSEWPFAEVAKGMEQLVERRNVGKIVLLPPEEVKK
nr:synaptic vesicle membrane protein VAT-1 homolog isoform X2 [Dermacentor andersoni]XP_054933207.1 synaptic vesicle membrane protein VAT-1 homolog isoform X2 [Dermacentor andersoni]